MEIEQREDLHELAVRAKTSPDAKYALFSRLNGYVGKVVKNKIEAHGFKRSPEFSEDAKLFALYNIVRDLPTFDPSQYQFQKLVSNASAWGIYLALQAHSGLKPHDFNNYRSALRKRQELITQLKREPTVPELAEYLGVKEEDVEWRLALPQIFQGKELDYYDPEAHKLLQAVPELEDARKILEILSERERFIFKRKVIDGASFREIAEDLHKAGGRKISASAIQSLFTTAQKKLRAEAARRDFEDTAPDLHAMAVEAQTDPKAGTRLKKAMAPFAKWWAERFVGERTPNAGERRPSLVSALADHGISEVMKKLPGYNLKFRDFDLQAQETMLEEFAKKAAKTQLFATNITPQKPKPTEEKTVKDPTTPATTWLKSRQGQMPLTVAQRIAAEGKPAWVPLDEDISHHAWEWLMSNRGSAKDRQAYFEAGKEALRAAVRKGNVPASERYRHEHAFEILRNAYAEKAKRENK